MGSSANSTPGTDPDTDNDTGLRQEDFLPLALRGFGEGWNAYIHSMAWFEGRLYCGTFRANLCLKRRQKDPPLQWPVWPINCPEPDEVFEKLDLRAQIWRMDPRDGKWENVQRSPIVIGKHGKEIPRECAYRGMVVFQGESDTKPVLYVTPFSNTDSTGPVVLRSEDGEKFLPCSEPGLGYDGVSSYRFLTVFKGRVYTSPVGKNKNVVNYSGYPIVFESSDPASGKWREVSEPGFGDPHNVVIFNMSTLNDFLYAGTFNFDSGFQLWKTDAEGDPPYRWIKVLERGAYRGVLNEGTLAMYPFKGALYIGTCIQDGGFDRVNKIGPAAGEVIRVFEDDTWELVIGSPKVTPEGLLIPTGQYRPGFNDIFNGYLWRMCEHRGHLYLGTVNWSTYIPYLDIEKWPKKVRDMLRSREFEDQINPQTGFDLWRTSDGDNWSPVSTDGFGTRFNVGVRNLVSTPIGLAVGTVNVFGPEVAVAKGDGHVYAPNPRGGAEVWLGDPEVSDTLRQQPVFGALENAERPRGEYRLPAVKPRPPRIAHVDCAQNDCREYDLDQQKLRALCDADGQQDALNEHIGAPDERQFDVEVLGAGMLPRDGAILFVSNNPGVPIFSGGTLLLLNVLYSLDVIHAETGRTAHLYAPLEYYSSLHPGNPVIGELDRLGYVPGTANNAKNLLKLGADVLIYPEGKTSRPPYEMHDFDPEFVRIAVAAGVKIVPIVFLGTHESHLLVERGEDQVLVNKRQPLNVVYKMLFLSAIDPCDVLDDVDDNAAVEALSEKIRTNIARKIENECARRPVVKLARKLQEETALPAKMGLKPREEE